MNHRVIPRLQSLPAELRDPAFFKRCLIEYGESALFIDTEEWLSDDNPYRRTLRPHVFKYLDFSRPLRRDELLTYTGLSANRTLLTIYESDFLLLPRKDFGAKRQDFEEFYSPRLKVLGEIVRPELESFLFHFLGEEISVTGHWTASSLKAYLEDYARSIRQGSDNKAMAAILGSADPVHAAKTFLIQLAGDFLLESSAMSRNILGRYGAIQSALFKVVIDEYGYGVHKTKHSTVFERLLERCGLDSSPHTYWQFYLTSSLLLNNYYNWICRDHSRFFRYLGAIYQAETAFIASCQQMADMMRQVFGADAEVQYFLEHVHIDQHHSRMVLDELIMPAIESFGEGIILDIVRGFEEGKLLGDIAEQDFCQQVRWSDNGGKYKTLHPAIYARIKEGSIHPKMQQFVEPRGELSVTHVHDGDELCHIQSGVMRFVTGHERYTLLHAGEGTVIQRNRLHGAIIDSEECVYNIYSIGDHQKCL